MHAGPKQDDPRYLPLPFAFSLLLERLLRFLRAVKSRMQRLSVDALASLGVLVVVLVTLMSVDVRVREQVQTVIASTSQVGDASGRIGEVGAVLFDAARTQSMDHAPMMIFIAAASVLVLFMVRT